MQGTYLRDEISKAGRVTRGVLQGVLQGACYKILTRGVLQNDLLRRVKLSNLTTHNFHACRQGSVTWGMLRRASYQGRATKGMYTRFLPSVRACYKGRVTVFEGVRRGGPVPRVSKTNQASSGKGGPALEKIGFLMFWAMWSPNCYIYRRSPLFWTLLLPVLCVHGHSPLFSWPVWSALFPLEQFSSSETGKRCASETGKRCATVDGRSPLSSWHVWSALFPLE